VDPKGIVVLYGLLLIVFLFICFLLAAIILIQKGKGSMGIGHLGGGTQMLFGGSGGQNIFEQVAWVLVALFMFGSLGLSVLRTKTSLTSKYAHSLTAQPSTPKQAPTDKA
jgi:protein translocase SecG subunit